MAAQMRPAQLFTQYADHLIHIKYLDKVQHLFQIQNSEIATMP